MSPKKEAFTQPSYAMDFQQIAIFQFLLDHYSLIIHKNAYAYLHPQGRPLLVSSLCQFIHEKGAAKSVLTCYND